MKNVILYNYNLNVSDLQKYEDDSYSFYINYEKYYFLKVSRPKEDIDEMLKIVNENQNMFHSIIININGTALTKVEDRLYMLIKIRGPEHNEIDLRDIILSQIPFQGKASILNRSNWGVLWSQKVDYLEYQVSELASSHPIIKKSFSYYVGLAENAITYFNMLNPEEVPLYISHRRINSPSISLDYYNPLNIVVDYRVRDIASYLKIEFFHRDTKEILNELDFVIQRNILTPFEYNLLFARLLYPSYYFDELSKILEKETDEQEILLYVGKTREYENFLNAVFHKLSHKSSMIKIDWLIKEN